MNNNKKMSFADFCKGLKKAANNEKFEIKLKEVKYHKRIENDEDKQRLLKDTKPKAIIEDLKTQKVFREVCNKYTIYPIEKSSRDNYTYLQDDIKNDDKIWHCHFNGKKNALFFTINDDTIFILDIIDYHL